MLKFEDIVRVKEGFYEGLIGEVINTSDSYEIGMGYRPTVYTVNFINTYNNERFLVNFSERYLEKTKGGTNE